MEESILGRLIIVLLICGGAILIIYSIKVPYNINRIANSLEEIARIMKKDKNLEEDLDTKEEKIGI